MAKFVVRETFPITGRGYALAGEITSGVIKARDILLIKANHELIPIEILSVEMLDKDRAAGVFFPALLISLADKEKIETLDLIGKELTTTGPVKDGSSFWDLLGDLTDVITDMIHHHP